MSGFDENPFGEPTINDPFSVSTVYPRVHDSDERRAHAAPRSNIARVGILRDVNLAPRADISRPRKICRGLSK